MEDSASEAPANGSATDGVKEVDEQERLSWALAVLHRLAMICGAT